MVLSSPVFIYVAVLLHAMTKRRVRFEVNCQDVSQSAQCRDKSHTTYQSLQSVLQAYALCARAKRYVTQWVRKGSQEDKLD